MITQLVIEKHKNPKNKASSICRPSLILYIAFLKMHASTDDDENQF